MTEVEKELSSARQCIDFAKTEIKKADGDLAEAAYWTFDALTHKYGTNARKLFYGSEESRDFGRAEFKVFMNTFVRASEELLSEGVKIYDVNDLVRAPDFRSARLSRETFQNMVAKVTNPKYMPTGNPEVGHNSSPTYLKSDNKENFLTKLALEDTCGYFAPEYPNQEDAANEGIYMVVPLVVQKGTFDSSIVAVVALKTMETFIGMNGTLRPWYVDETIPVDLKALEQTIEY